MRWKIDNTRHAAINTTVEYLETVDKDLVSNQLKRLLVMAKKFLPPMKLEEARLLALSFNGVTLPPVDSFPRSYLPELIAEHVQSGFVEAPEVEPIRREIEDGDLDEDWNQQYDKLPQIQFVKRLKTEIDPLQAYLLLVAVECFWTSRQHFPEEDANLREFFNIRDSQA